MVPGREMHKDASSSSSTLAQVRLPPLPLRQGPGSAHRLAGSHPPPTPPPRPESSLIGPPPPPPVSTSSPASGPGRGHQVPVDTPVSLQLPTALSSLDPAPSPITLTNPRSAASRAQNLYVDTPFKTPGPPGLATKLIRPCQSLPTSVKSRTRPVTVSPVSPPVPGLHTNSVSVITTPPFSSNHCSKAATTSVSDKASTSSPPAPTPVSDSIICVMCGRCRCAACATAKPLPSVWLCHNSWLCSADSCVDTVSCMCCVKAAFYHCGERLDQESDKEDNWVDSPCSCSHNKW